MFTKQTATNSHHSGLPIQSEKVNNSRSDANYAIDYESVLTTTAAQVSHNTKDSSSDSQAGVSIGYKDEDLKKCQQIDGDSDKRKMEVDRLMDVAKVLKHEMLSMKQELKAEIQLSREETVAKNTWDATDKN